MLSNQAASAFLKYVREQARIAAFREPKEHPPQRGVSRIEVGVENEFGRWAHDRALAFKNGRAVGWPIADDRWSFALDGRFTLRQRHAAMNCMASHLWSRGYESRVVLTFSDPVFHTRDFSALTTLGEVEKLRMTIRGMKANPAKNIAMRQLKIIEKTDDPKEVNRLFQSVRYTIKQAVTMDDPDQYISVLRSQGDSDPKIFYKLARKIQATSYIPRKPAVGRIPEQPAKRLNDSDRRAMAEDMFHKIFGEFYDPHSHEHHAWTADSPVPMRKYNHIPPPSKWGVRPDGVTP